ncbi:MAG: energy transducer TonB [Terriglobia bacterium]
MFEDMLESARRRQRRNPWAYAISLLLQTIVLGLMILIPLLYTEALPKQVLLSWVAAPPPPPPPPPPPAEVQRIVRKVSLMEAGKLRAPRKIPERVEIIKEEQVPTATVGVVGGVPGVAGGQLGGVIGGVIGSIPVAPPPPPEPPKRIRVSSGVQSARKIHHVRPVYPPLAKQARIRGTVRLEAIIAKDGTIQNLTVISGHPLLVQAALDAVSQWRYEPTLLNNEPVEIQTFIDVIFKLN